MASAVAASGSATPQWIRPLNLSKQQKGDLVEFLRALTSRIARIAVTLIAATPQAAQSDELTDADLARWKQVYLTVVIRANNVHTGLKQEHGILRPVPSERRQHPSVTNRNSRSSSARWPCWAK